MTIGAYRALFDDAWVCSDCNSRSHSVTPAVQSTTAPRPSLADVTNAWPGASNLPFMGEAIIDFQTSYVDNGPPDPDTNMTEEEKTDCIQVKLNKNHLFGKGLTICHININGLKSKFEELSTFLLTHHCGFFGITESKLSSDDDWKLFHIDGYTMYRRDRDRAGGGSIMYISKTMTYQVLTLPFNLPFELEVTVLRLRYEGMKPVILVLIYNPPNHSKPAFLEALNSIMLFLQQSELEYVILGDVNIDLLKCDPITFKLFSLRKQYGLHQLMFGATRKTAESESCIDHIYVNTPRHYTTFDHFPFCGSDHHLTFVTRKVRKNPQSSTTIQYRPYGKSDFQLICNTVSKIDFTYLSNNQVQKNSDIFTNQILEILSVHCPLKTRHFAPKPKPWFTAELKKICQRRDTLKTLSAKLKNNESWKLYQAARNYATSRVRRAKKNYFKNKFHDDCRSESIWSNIDKLTNYKLKDRRAMDALKDPLTKVTTYDKPLICDILVNSFTVKSELLPSDIDTVLEIKKHCTSPHDVRLKNSFTLVSPEEVTEAVKYLKKKGGPGPSFIPMTVFKRLVDVLSAPLALFFTSILILCNIPISFKSATVIPLYKGKGSFLNPDNYRPIAILSPMVKIFERVLFKKILPILEPKFIDEQHGFRKGRSCQTALTLFTQDILKKIDGRNCRVGAVFVDLRKAFNSVDHNILLRKMISEFDFDPHLTRLFRNYLDGRVFRLSFGDSYSTYYPDTCGVPQGSALGPLLFTIFVNDVAKVLDLPFFLYADDLVFYTDGTDPAKIVDSLSRTLTTLDTWFRSNKLTINEAKTEFMLFHKAHDTKLGTIPPLILNGNTIKRVLQFKYLGIILDPHLSFQAHYERVDSRLGSAISRLQSVKRCVSPFVMEILIKAYILPIYDYCIDIWCSQTDRQLNTLQSKIDKLIFSSFFPSLFKKVKRYSHKASFNLYFESLSNQSSLLQKLNILSVKERVQWSLLKNTFQILFAENPLESMLGFFTLSSNSRTSRTFPLLKVEAFKSETFKRSVKFRATSFWNSLPKTWDISNTSLAQFKKMIFDHLTSNRHQN
jgi:exonuclease III